MWKRALIVASVFVACCLGPRPAMSVLISEGGVGVVSFDLQRTYSAPVLAIGYDLQFSNGFFGYIGLYDELGGPIIDGREVNTSPYDPLYFSFGPVAAVPLMPFWGLVDDPTSYLIIRPFVGSADYLGGTATLYDMTSETVLATATGQLVETTPSVPIPSSVLLMGSGVLCLVGLGRSRFRK